MKVLNLITILILLINTHFTYAKDVKFHAPETEAEKALDKILRTEEGLDLGQMKYKDITTKAFRADEARQQAEYEKKWGCKDGDGEICTFSEVSRITCAHGYLTNIGFLYYSQEYKGNLYIFAVPSELAKYSDILPRYRAFEPNYAIKQEDGNWKIDGVCCEAHKINHDECAKRFSTFIL
jgi:hypothetical protein